MRVKLEQVCSRGSSNLMQKEVTELAGAYPIFGAAGQIGTADFYHQEKPYVAVVKDGAGIGRTMLLPAFSSVIGTLQYLIPNEKVLPDYLYYVVQHMKLAKYFSGATIPHIYFRDYKNEEFNLESLDRQKEIVSILNRTQHIISHRRAQLAKLDELVKCRFVELFGDPESESSKWKKVPLSTLCSSIVRGPFGSALKKEYFVPKAENTVKVYEQKNAIEQSHCIGCYYVSNDKYLELKRFECKSGDFIMSCSGTIGKIYQLPQEAELGIINQALCKFTLNTNILPEVFLTFMRHSISILETKGSGIQNIGAVSYIKNIGVPLAPMQIQQYFSAFVRRIDKLRFVIQESLDETQKLFDSLMQEYFD